MQKAHIFIDIYSIRFWHYYQMFNSTRITKINGVYTRMSWLMIETTTMLTNEFFICLFLTCKLVRLFKINIKCLNLGKGWGCYQRKRVSKPQFSIPMLKQQFLPLHQKEELRIRKFGVQRETPLNAAKIIYVRYQCSWKEEGSTSNTCTTDWKETHRSRKSACIVDLKN